MSFLKREVSSRAADADVLIVAAVALAPGQQPTLSDVGFRAEALHLVQPNWALARPKGGRLQRLGRPPVAEHSAHDLRVRLLETVVAHRAPNALVAHLYSPFHLRFAIHQTHLQRRLNSFKIKFNNNPGTTVKDFS